MAAHARFSPSAANRIIHCPPSLVLGEQFEDEESQYAAEGSAGHALAEHLIKKHLKQRTKRPVSDYYSDDLLEAVDEYVCYVIDQIEKAKQECTNPVFAVEQRVSVNEYIVDCYGTADMVIVTDSKVHIIDLKLGRGVAVAAEDNPQLKIYGLGVLEMVDMLYDITEVELTIVQPRLNSLSSWSITPGELRIWGLDILKPAGALALVGGGEFAVGSWCRFCKARNQCRARAEEFLKIAQMDFREPALLSDAEISEVLRISDELAKWASDVYTFAQDQAITHHKQWPGYKLVEGRSVRKYTSEEDVVAAAEKAGYTDIYKKSLIGITEMQRLMGKDNFNQILGGLVFKPKGKITLVPDSDKRQAIQQITAEEDFQD